MLNCRLADCPALSVNVIVKDEVPGLVGAPVMAPSPVSVKPAGNAPPVSAQRYGGVPPFPTKLCEYGRPTVPPGGADGVIVG
jgi:hypothetical protein